MYIVKLEKGVYLASWEGDPGRTLVQLNAKRFSTHEEASCALIAARQYRPFGNARIMKTTQQGDAYKRCNCCGRYVTKSRWIYHGNMEHRDGRKPVCARCE